MYDYATQRPRIFTEDGQIMFTKIRDKAKILIKESGAATAEKLISGICGDSWDMLACVDRLVELKELFEIVNNYSRAGQHRVFISFDWARS